MGHCSARRTIRFARFLRALCGVPAFAGRQPERVARPSQLNPSLHVQSDGAAASWDNSQPVVKIVGETVFNSKFQIPHSALEMRLPKSSYDWERSRPRRSRRRPR